MYISIHVQEVLPTGGLLPSHEGVTAGSSEFGWLSSFLQSGLKLVKNVVG